MVRFLLWLLFFYILWKILKSFMSPPRRPQNTPKPPTSAPFQDVQDAEFEDITPKPPPDSPASPPK